MLASKPFKLESGTYNSRVQFGQPSPFPSRSYNFRNTTPARTVKLQSTMTKATTLNRTLVSFDVDGTLIRSAGQDANKLHREAFSQAFKDVFDLDTDIDVIPHHGSTDPLILVKVMMHHGTSKEEAMAALPAMKDSMVKHFLANADRAGQGLEVLPGVVDLLTQLKQAGALICLVTGNLEPIGWAKMKALGIQHLFTSPPFFGGFGSDFCSGNTEESWKDRTELVRIAGQRAAVHCPPDQGGISSHFHVGDAPMDVQAAAAAGVVPIGVTTGIYTREELLGVCPAATVVESINCEQVLEMLGLIGSTK